MTTSRFPQHPDKHGGEMLIDPAHLVAPYLERDVVVPRGAVVCYSPFFSTLLARRGYERVSAYPPPWHTMWLSPDDPTGVGVVEGFGIGAPAAAFVVDELFALGVERVVNIGLAGALDERVGFGDLVLCTGALRDEGVSHHYAPPARYADPSAELTTRLRDALGARAEALVEGATWTTDAFFRESREEALTYRDEGVVTVEMEAAALFTLAAHRERHAAAAFVVSDHLLAGEGWAPASDRSLLTRGLETLFDAAREALA